MLSSTLSASHNLTSPCPTFDHIHQTYVCLTTPDSNVQKQKPAQPNAALLLLMVVVRGRA